MNEQQGQSLADPDVQECPWDFYADIRENAPVYLDPKLGLYVISRYEDVLQALRMHDVLSNQLAFRPDGIPEAVLKIYDEDGYGEMIDTMVSNDPPSHTRYRSLVDKAFTPTRVRKMEPYIEGITSELIDTFIDDGQADFYAQFAVKLPMTVIADQLGVPREHMDRFKQWSDASVATVGMMVSEDEYIEAAKLVVDFQHYFVDRLEERRRDPQDDMLTDLVQARVEGERALDTKELLSILQQLLVAGNETTTNALSAGVRQLAQNPDQAAMLRENPDRYINLAEEVLRIDAPVQGLFRMTLEDVELGGTVIPKGSVVNLRYGSANRDDRRFIDAASFDVCRKGANKHLAFGGGIHHCIGQQLAKRELIVGLRAINERLDNIQLACADDELRHFPSVILRGYDSLPITFRKRA